MEETNLAMETEHYLQRELYDLLKSDRQISEFVISGSTDGIWFWDLIKPENEWMSPEFWRLFGYEPAKKKHLASEWQDMIFHEDLETALDNFNKHAADPEHPYDQLVRYRHKDGSTVWVRCRGLILRDENGTPTRMLGAHNDVTKLKIAALNAVRYANELERANDSLALCQEIIETSPLGKMVWRVDDPNVPASMILEIVNPSAASIFDIAPSDEDRSLSEAVPSLIESGLPEQFVSVYRNGTPIETEYRIRGRGTNEEFFSVRAYRVRDRYVVTSFENVTRERQAEDRLRRSNEELEQFAYVASHDLQEPLRMVTSFTKVLSEEYAEELDDTARRYLNFAFDGAMRMHSLINDLLSLSRVDSTEHLVEDTDLGAIIEGVVEELKFSGTLGNTKVVFDGLPIVRGDGKLLRQLFENLITNAIKFNERERPEVRIRAVAVGEIFEISVEDNGIGIDIQHRERVFRMFQRLNKRTRYEGTGIGLAIAAKIVARHGGKIWLESSSSSGSVFRLTLLAK